MRGRLLFALPFLVLCAAFDVVLALWLDWSFERAVILAPIVVAVVGAVGFLVVLWSRIAWESVRSRPRG